jgi:hypothetical protein
MKLYSYLVGSLPDGRLRWKVFRENRKVIRSGSAKDKHETELAALYAIDALKIQDRKRSF